MSADDQHKELIGALTAIAAALKIINDNMVILKESIDAVHRSVNNLKDPMYY
jgi:hypothetical protein